MKSTMQIYQGIEQNVQVGQEWKQNKVLVDQDQSRNAKIKQNVQVGQEWKQNKMLIDQDQSRKSLYTWKFNFGQNI
jgi:hypothetical protein